MEYTIDRSIEFLNTILFKSESGTEYQLFYYETAPNSKVWTFSFKLISGTPNSKEVFQTISTIQKLLTEKGGIAEKLNINECMITIDGKDKEEIDKKTKVFTRWIKSPYEYEIMENPVINIEGRMENIYLNTNLIHIKRKSVTIEDKKVGAKFCFNCGSENKEDYKFCPNCGQNLKQA